jgi:peptidoglycan/xylan/chitin deacetylase (PgdA/CDA1 family)
MNRKVLTALVVVPAAVVAGAVAIPASAATTVIEFSKVQYDRQSGRRHRRRYLTSTHLIRNRLGEITALALCLAAGLLLVLPGEAGASPSRPLMVSLTFDDGVADQLVASRILRKYGVSGTFYISSALIGLPGYMTREDLNTLVADRHEIGGHTATHDRLTAVSPAEANRQICQDRRTLLSWGYKVSSFAYPFSALNDSIEKVVERCGYGTARAVGSLKSPDACARCPVTESVPPADRYATRTPSDIDTRWSLADLRSTVTRAEAAGGWLAFNFHHICDSCSPASIRPAVFDQFIAWLAARSSVATAVRTVRQVIGGGVKPAVAPIPAPPPAGHGINALRNPSLETASSINPTLPDCWASASSGTTMATYSRTRDEHRGAYASRISVTSGTDGDAKLVPRFDLGDCSPSVAADHIYEVSAWYKSTTDVYFILYQRNAIGQWAYSMQSPWFPAAKAWTKVTWITPAVPSEMVAASFGLAIDRPGILVIDDLGFVDYTPATAPPGTPSPTTTADRGVSPTDAADRSDARNWLGVVGIIIAVAGLLAGLVHTQRRKSR